MATEFTHHIPSFLRSLPRKSILGLGILVLAALLFISLISQADETKGTDNLQPISDIINPSISFSQEDELIDRQLEKEVRNIINKHKNETPLVSASVYYRNLRTGQWFVINDITRYTTASLRKIFTLITVLKQAEIEPELLGVEVTYHGEFDYMRNVSDQTRAINGNSYTLEQLIQLVFVSSDNLAHAMIVKYLEEKYPGILTKNLADFEMTEAYADSMISILPYAHTYETLYNASYLNEDMSRKAIEYLSSSNYDNGITAPIDPSIRIADKFGYRQHDYGNLKELHNCGIIYHPVNPYSICIMTKGQSKENQANLIRKISAKVWEEVN